MRNKKGKERITIGPPPAPPFSRTPCKVPPYWFIRLQFALVRFANACHGDLQPIAIGFVSAVLFLQLSKEDWLLVRIVVKQIRRNGFPLAYPILSPCVCQEELNTLP